MKVTPIAGAGSALGENTLGGSRFSADKLAAAKALAAGQTPPTPRETESVQAPTVPTITMRTNQNTDRREAPVETAPVDPVDEAPPATEETRKPLDPQAALVAKQRRALQVMEKENSELKKAAEAKAAEPDWKARLKDSPLLMLQEAGVTYDDLTQAILASRESQDVLNLRNEIKTIKEEFDNALTDRDGAAEKQVLAQMSREVDKLTSNGEAFETIRATKSQQDVVDLIYRTWKTTGEVLSEPDACKLVEDQLVEELVPLTNLGKFKSKLAPVAPPPVERSMKTLTNRDTAKASTGRRERALAAFYGSK